MKLSRSSYFALSFVWGTLLLWGCANQGAPEGGPYDTQPPRLLQALPTNKATNVQGKRFVLTFDEHVKLSSQQDKIIVSPPQQEAARITASGHRVVIQLADSLRPSTTYSFYFDDVITDNNEDNPLEDFSYLVSTGSQIDTMQLSGRVIDALTYEPVEGLVVGAYPSEGFTDSLVLTQAFPFVSKTNKQGLFTIRGLAKTSYRAFATRDNDANYRYNEKSEGLALDGKEHLLRLLDSVRTDTLRIDSIVRRDTLHRDSLITRPYTYYYPNDLLLRYAVPLQRREGLERSSRPDSLVCRLEFLAEPKQLPRLHSLDKPNVPVDQLYWMTVSGKTVDCWILDEALIRQDSVRLAVTYTKSDSLGEVHPQTDTLTFLRPVERAKTRDGKPATHQLQLSAQGARGLFAGTLADTIYLQANRPLASLDRQALRLEVKQDTLPAVPQPFELIQDSLDRLRYILEFPREYGKSYTLHIDSAQVRDIYGSPADSLAFTQQIQPEKELGALTLTIEGISQHALVQLLNKSDAVLTQALASLLPQDSLPSIDSLGQAKPGSVQVHFRDLKPADYFIRLIVDADGDGAFSPGDYPTTSPEQVYYCPMTFAIKKGFTSQETWDLHATPQALSKPEALRKVKPDEVKKQREDKNVAYYQRWGRRKR